MCTHNLSTFLTSIPGGASYPYL